MRTKPNRTLARATTLDRARWSLLARAALVLTAASALVAVAPFRRAIALGTVPLRRRARPVAVADVVWAVEAWSRRMPWRTKCIEQGIAAQRLLRQGGVDARLHYGAHQAGHDSALEAHVWVTVDGRPVIGAAEAPAFAEIAIYPPE